MGPAYQVISVYERDRKLLEFLDQRGIRPGTRFRVRTRNYDGTLSLAAKKRISTSGVRPLTKSGSQKAQLQHHC